MRNTIDGLLEISMNVTITVHINLQINHYDLNSNGAAALKTKAYFALETSPVRVNISDFNSQCEISLAG